MCDSLVWVELAATQLQDAHKQLPNVGFLPSAVRFRPLRAIMYLPILRGEMLAVRHHPRRTTAANQPPASVLQRGGSEG